MITNGGYDSDDDDTPKNVEIFTGWKLIQANTFTNWCNEQLKPVGKTVENIQLDFRDGVLLIDLVRLLLTAAGRPLKKQRLSVKQNPKMQVQKVGNVSQALQMLERDNVKLVNIGNEDIVNGSAKLILGLIWQLILKYQISGGDTSNKKRIPPKRLMLEWMNSVLPEKHQVRNFARDWNDGIALCALINFCEPSLCQDWESYSSLEKVENCKRGMTLAKDKLDIPMVLTPEDMASPEVDELSGMTYFSYFVGSEGPGWYATLNWVRSKVPEKNIKNFGEDWNDGIVLCGLVNAVGGDIANWQELDPEDKVGNLQKGMNAGQVLEAKPNMTAEEMSSPDVNELALMAYAASFRRAKGVVIEKPLILWGVFAMVELKHSQGIELNAEVNEETKGNVKWTGLTNNVIVLVIKITSDRAIPEDISASVNGPGEAVPVLLKKVSLDTLEAMFTPQQEGIHSVVVRCRGDPIQGCPLNIKVEEDQSSFPKKVQVGKITTAIVGEEIQFQVDVTEAGQGELGVEMVDGIKELSPRIVKEGLIYTVNTIAQDVGEYTVNITWNKEPVTDEKVKLRVFDPHRVKAFGDGLSKGREDTEAHFVIDARNAGNGELKVLVEGPKSMAKVTIVRNEEKTYTVTYIPTEVGTFNIKITFGGRQIKNSPFNAQITDPRKVRVVGLPQLDENDQRIIYTQQGYTFEFQCEESGPGHLEAEVQGPDGTKPLTITNLSDDRHAIKFIPVEEGDYTIVVRHATYQVKGSPLLFVAKRYELPVDHTKVFVRGAGIKEAVAYNLSEFIIDGSKGGAGVPTVTMTGMEDDIKVSLEPLSGQGGNVYKATYVLENDGTYLVHISWSEKQITGSPFKVLAIGNPHAERVSTKGEALKSMIKGKTSKVTVDATRAAKGNDLSMRCMGPTLEANLIVKSNEDGTQSIQITPNEVGIHSLEVKYGDQHIAGSPFQVKVSAPPDASKVKCYGPGLDHGIKDTVQGRFICETKGAGAGQLKVKVHGPKGAFKVSMRRNDTKDRTIDISYNPTELGEYSVHVLWSGIHVPHSPFKIIVVETEKDLEEARRDFPTGMEWGRQLSQNGGWTEDL